MFALKSLGKALWGDTEGTEILVVPAGEFYLVRPRSPKGPRECLFRDARLAVRRTTVPLQYQLVVSRVFDEGEAELEGVAADGDDLVSGDDEVDANERVWLIDPVLGLQRGHFEGSPSLLWSEPDGDPEEQFEFVLDTETLDSQTAKVYDQLNNTLRRCLFEKTQGRVYTAKDAKDLPPLPQAIVPTLIPRSFTKTTKAKGTVTATQSAEATPILEVTASLYLFNAESSIFMSQAEKCFAALMRDAEGVSWLWVHDGERSFVTQPVESSMNATVNRQSLSFIWCFYDEEDYVYTWCLRFADPAPLDALNKAYTQCLYEAGTTGGQFDQLKPVDQEYLSQANQEDIALSEAFRDRLNLDQQTDLEHPIATIPGALAASQEPATWGAETAGQAALGSEEEEEESVGTTSEEEFESCEEDEEVTDSEADDEDETAQTGTGGPRTSALAPRQSTKNSLLAVGYKHDRSFVVRGDKIGVFRHTPDDSLEFDTTISGLESTTGRTLDPSKVMLHQEDSSLIIMDKTDRSHLYRMDLEYGKVVEDWHVHEQIPTVNIAPSSKFAQTTGQQTLVGLSGNALYRIDPRLAGQKFVAEEAKTYATKNKFQSLATTEAGHIAVGSEKGDIRLYTKLNQVAKTLLPALGDPILGIDVTADGRFVVATCRSYLLLLDTVIASDGAGRTGFTRSMPARERPIPVKLQLDPKHVAYMGMPVTFTPAHFNTGGTDRERRIVTSTGPYVITWNFRRVLQGHRYDYHIKKYADNVVADNFRYGKSRAIVVALPQDVTMATRKQLGTPQKVFQTPVRNRSDIVNSPY
ncbi:Vacuolar import and degradation protein 27 [Tieghemiomyces parasiticus]|uniref:Vacuolar import and degradation protein 27 n=1 Tax=Tieghemiomyces parasiticus TaxID=78921 RepID=A0A9W8A251_9FUNG|nr:Vacuolar import and degradation protein 27 [Tieghemiomyces parasiticus]